MNPPIEQPELTDHCSDDQLMLRMQTGDSVAFEMLVARHQQPLISFFIRNIRDVQQAEDLTQETLLRVFNQCWDYLPRGRFRGWMYRIARNLMIDNIRKQSHDALIKAYKGKAEDDEIDVLASIADEMQTPWEKANLNELKFLVDETLDLIPEDQRLTFTMHHFGGLTLAEVADVMQATLPTTKSRLRLAREKLQERLRTKGVTREPAS